ncbi:VOC family protein, partial [Pseudomonas aeruginosa]|nr:VOC family protein [Pseudomonas aeruginosa]
TIASGALNALLIQGGLIGASPWGRMLLIKCALVAGMVVIALVNRYVLVPRMSASGSQAESLILRTTQAEIGLGALALLADDGLSQPGIVVKTSSPKGEHERLPNPTLAVTDGSVTVKFHPWSIEQIVASEQADT